MAFGAVDPRAVGVVEQHELAADLVLVGGDVFAEDAQVLAAVALRHVTEHLIVRTVFLDDIDHVLDRGRLADALRYRTRFGIRSSGELGGLDQLATAIG